MKQPPLNKDDVTMILKKYFRQNDENYHPIKEGIENTNYLITSGNKKFVLRVYHPKRTLSEVKIEIEAILYLAKNKIPVPDVVPNLEKKNITSYNNYLAVLFSFVEGHHVPFEFMDTDLAREIGIQLAKMHEALLAFHPATKTSKNRLLDIKNIKPTNKTLLSSKQHIDAELKSLNKKTLRTCVIHGDITRENLMVQGSRLAAFLDFDDLHEDYLAYDLAVAITHLFIAKSFGIDWAGLTYFMKGYRSVLTLEDSEKKALVPLIKLRNLTLALDVYNRITEGAKDQEKLLSIKNSVLEKIRLIESYEKRLSDVLS